MRFLPWLMLVGFVALGVSIYTTDSVPAVGTVSPEALQKSLAREVGEQSQAERATCRPRANGSFRCGVETDPGSGPAVFYILRRRGGRCWRARARGRREGLPLRASGCALLRDQIRLSDRLT